jgi:Ribosomal protein S18
MLAVLEGAQMLSGCQFTGRIVGFGNMVRGKIRSRRVSGLTARQQRGVVTAIKNAREMTLLSCPAASR